MDHPYGAKYGFGRIVYGDYKLVSICKGSYKVKMFSLANGNWKTVGVLPTQGSIMGNGLYFEGRLYWKSSILAANTCFIVSIDLRMAIFHDVAVPNFGEGVISFALGVVAQGLCMLSNFVNDRECDVWIMTITPVNQAWNRLYSIRYPDHNLNPRIEFVQGWTRYSCPIFITEDGRVLLHFGVHVILFNTIDMTYEIVEEFARDTCAYVETLVKPILTGRRYSLRSAPKVVYS